MEIQGKDCLVNFNEFSYSSSGKYVKTSKNLW